MELTKEDKLALAMLDSYKRQSLRIKRELTPLLYDEKRDIIRENNKNKPTSQYFQTLHNMLNVYGVETKHSNSANEERSLLFNSTVSFSYINNAINRMHHYVYTIDNKAVLKLDEYIKIAKKFNVNIDDDIKDINSQIEIYKSNKVYNEFYQECERKKDLLKELTIYIDNLENNSFNAALKKEIPTNSFIGQSYPTDFRKVPELSGLVDILDRTKEEFKNYFVESKPIVDLTPTLNLIDNTDKLFTNIHLKLRAAGYQSCLADIYHDNIKDKSVIGFLKNKNDNGGFDDKNIDIYPLPEWSKCPQFILFEDGSALIKNYNNEYQEAISSKDLIDLRGQLVGEYINEHFKKNPTIAKTFKKMKDIAYVESIDQFTKILNKYKENEAILKINDFRLMETFKNEAAKNEHHFTTYEKLDDVMSKIIRTHKVRQYIHSIASNKYAHLYNEDTYKVAGELYDLKLPDNSLQDYIGKKLAAFKTPEQFNAALGSFVDSFNSFTAEATLKKAATFGVNVISEKDNIVILRIEDYEQSYTMGSTSWCISRDEAYFKSYADDREQYFIYDFSKRSTDNTSMIGVTLETNGDYNIAHYKDDSDCYENEESLISYLQEAVAEFKNNVKNQNKPTIKSKISL